MVFLQRRGRIRRTPIRSTCSPTRPSTARRTAALHYHRDRAASPDGDDFHQPWIDPTDSNRIVLGSDQGASISLNGGATWSSWFNQPTGQFYHVATGTIVTCSDLLRRAARQRLGVRAHAVRTRSACTMFDWTPIVAGGESGSIAPDPLQSAMIVFGDNVTRRIWNNHWIFNRWIRPSRIPRLFRNGMDAACWSSQRPIPGCFTTGGKWCFRSARQRRRREKRSVRISTRPNPGNPATLDPSTASPTIIGIGPRRGVVYTTAPSPVSGGEIWAGTDDGKVWITERREGAHWRDVTPRLASVRGAKSASSKRRLSIRGPRSAAGHITSLCLTTLQPVHLPHARRCGASYQLIAKADSNRRVRERGDAKISRQTAFALRFRHGTRRLEGFAQRRRGLAAPAIATLPVTSVRDLAISPGVPCHRDAWLKSLGYDDPSPLYQVTARMS